MSNELWPKLVYVDINKLCSKEIKDFEVLVLLFNEEYLKTFILENKCFSKLYERALTSGKKIILMDPNIRDISKTLKKYLNMQKIRANKILIIKKV